MRIFCFGDSNTYGYDPRSYLGNRYDAAHRWVDLLVENTGWTVINAGVNGREIPKREEDVFQFSRLLYKTQPIDLLLIMLGSNDLLQGASIPEITQRIRTFLSQIAVDKEKIILIAPPPMKKGTWVTSDRLLIDSAQLITAYQNIAEEGGIHFVNTENWGTELAFDGVHFSPTGHCTFAKQLQPILETIVQKTRS